MIPDPPDTAWRKSTWSGNNGGCVEIAPVVGGVAVRDSKQPTRSRLVFSTDSWTAFVAGVRHGEFDRSPQA